MHDRDDPTSAAGVLKLCLGHLGQIPSFTDGFPGSPEGGNHVYRSGRQRAPENLRDCQLDGSRSPRGKGAAAVHSDLVPACLGARLLPGGVWRRG